MKYPKVDVNFFLDRVPEMLMEKSHMGYFQNLFTLYLDGVLSQSEFFTLLQDIVDVQA